MPVTPSVPNPANSDDPSMAKQRERPQSYNESLFDAEAVEDTKSHITSLDNKPVEKETSPYSPPVYDAPGKFHEELNDVTLPPAPPETHHSEPEMPKVDPVHVSEEAQVWGEDSGLGEVEGKMQTIDLNAVAEAVEEARSTPISP